MAAAKSASAKASSVAKQENATDSGQLYADHQKIYPRAMRGFFRSLKNWATLAMLGAYFLGPWLRWERPGPAPDQAILLDMTNRRGYILGIEIWPQEVYYVTGLLILAAIGLFLATALLGRVWCGFTCIQTVFTDVFVKVERLLEGDRNARIKRDRGRMSFDTFWRKTVKVAVWTLIAAATGWTWVIYFNDAPSTTLDLLRGDFDAVGWGVISFAGLVAAFCFVLAGWAREQVCIYMCPWPRFQGAMFDEDSLIVTYEAWRGEPRGFAKKGADFEARGHCVDCTLCVQVCPTGVDIREGSQLACIGCGLCIDACNSMMDRFNLPRGLITYDSTNNQVARSRGEPTKLRLIRPRTVIYAVLLVLIVGVMAFTLATRSRLDVSVLQERSPLFVPLTDGRIRNGYTLKILNMRPESQVFRLSAEGIEGATLRVVGHSDEETSAVELPVKADSVGAFRLYVTVNPEALGGPSADLSLTVENLETGETVEHETVVAGPGR